MRCTFVAILAVLTLVFSAPSPRAEFGTRAEAVAMVKRAQAKFKQVGPYMEPPFVIETITDATPASDSAEESAAEGEEGDSKAEKKAPKVAARKRSTEPEIVEKANVRELFDYVKEAGSRGYEKTRYKGLGEMNSEQLWQTTMDPERRTLLSVKLEDLAECETIFSTLMGEDVEARRKFIEDNALDVKNLDI